MDRAAHRRPPPRRQPVNTTTSPSSPPSAAPAAPSLLGGERITLDIHDLAFGGEGVGRHGDLVVFVPYTCPGERVEAKVVSVQKRFARAVLARVVRPAPERVEPPCTYFGECGGCQYQHLAYDAQVRWKHKQVADLFERIGGFEGPVVRPVIPCPAPYHYRNRILVRSQWNRPARKLDLGYMRDDCGLVCDIERCEIAEPALNEALREWRRNPPPKGGLKTTLRIPAEGWEVPEHSFFQNNFHALPALLDAARAFLADAGSRHLVDAYCGVGFFGIELAKAVESVVGIELDAPAIRAARRNAQSRGALNAEFVAGDTERLLPGVLRRLDASQATVLVDPPRVGCRPPVIELLRRVQPRQVLYVSCHPATLARDLKDLCAGGRFVLHAVQPVDMFPQTQHVECVADVRLVPPEMA